jgi:DNA-binding response OmpR family regulator
MTRPAPAPPARRRLLLADDDDDVAAVFTRAFTAAGFEVTRARAGAEAVAVAQSEGELAAAVVDLVLPGVGGLEVVRAIRRAHPRCRIVAVTGLDQPVTERLFRESGADLFLAKPVELKELMKAVGVET